MRKITKVVLKILSIPFLLLLTLIGYSLINEAIEAKSDLVNYPPPGKVISIEGKGLHIDSVGEKSDSLPTVILEAGGGMCSADWKLVQDEAAKFVRVCSWDRPGYGWSDLNEKPRTSMEAAMELHELLNKSGEKPPYILVGHSYGGHTIRIFAKLFPNEVSGLLFLDTRPDNMLEIPVLKEIGSGQTERLKFFSFLSKIGITRLIGQDMIPVSFQEKLPDYPIQICFRPKYFKANVSEAQNIALSDEQAKQSGLIGDIPLIVVRHGIPDIFSTLLPPDLERAESEWQTAQEKISNLSTNSRNWVAEKSGHNIHIDQPEIVIQGIKNLVDNHQ